MTWIIHDEDGKQHEILEDENVVVLAQNRDCARAVMCRLGLPPHARQFTVSPDPRRLEGYRPHVIIRTACAYKHRNAVILSRILERSAWKMPTPVRTILVDCR